MAYLPVSLPSDTPDVVQRVVRDALEPFLQDIHTLFLLPLPGSTPGVGCNFAAAQVLLAAISGVSAVLYSTTGTSGKVFQHFLIDCYPWKSEPTKGGVVPPPEAARILYEEFRNPLTHASGTLVQGVKLNRRELVQRTYFLQINRVGFPSRPARGLTDEQIQELEAEPVRPGWLPMTLAVDVDAQKRILTVEALYWGLRCAIRTLCSDPVRMKAAVSFFAKQIVTDESQDIPEQ